MMLKMIAPIRYGTLNMPKPIDCKILSSSMYVVFKVLNKGLSNGFNKASSSLTALKILTKILNFL